MNDAKLKEYNVCVWKDHFLDSTKEIIVFDLDGTLAMSKSFMDEEMSQLLIKLLQTKKVGVMSGGSYKQFQKQFLTSLNAPSALLENLFLFPTCATTFHRFENAVWSTVYEELLSDEEKSKIMTAFSHTLNESVYQKPENVFGEILEDRRSQITFSACGQDAPIEVKEEWDIDKEKRQKIRDALLRHIPEFEVRIGGTTSIDVTKKGIDKGYGMEQIVKHLQIPKQNILFVGDALFPGGNDYAAYEAGVDSILIANPEETKKIIKQIIE
jgi:phosphomannomutase